MTGRHRHVNNRWVRVIRVLAGPHEDDGRKRRERITGVLLESTGHGGTTRYRKSGQDWEIEVN